MRQVVEYIIENFQSHLKTVVKPAPAGQVTTIVGPSRNGKSAIFRALRKLYYNIPEGTGFIRIGAGFCRITAIYDDGYRVVYYRTRGGISRYTIIDPAGNKQDYNDGKSVPLEVQEITGISPVTVGDMTINLNLAEQLDGPFLGTKTTSAPARAKIIGKLAGTEEIDYAGKQLATDIYRRKQDEKRLDKRVGQLTDQLKEYDYLEELGANIEVLSGIREQVKQLTVLRNKLQELVTQRQVLQIKIRAEEEAYIVTKFVEPTAELLARMDRDVSLLTTLQRLHEQRVIIIDGVNQADRVLTETASLEEAGKDLALAGELAAKQGNLIKLSDERRVLVEGISKANAVLLATQNIGQAENELARATELFAKREKLVKLQVEKSSLRQQISASEVILQETAGIPQAEENLKQLESLAGTQSKLSILTAQRRAIKQLISQAEQTLTDTSGLEVVEKAIITAQEKLERYKKLDILQLEQKDLAKKISASQEQIKSLDLAIETAYQDYVRCLQEAGKCPTCGAEIELERIKEVV